MSIPQELFGTTYQIPETRGRKWGPTVTTVLLKLMQAVDAGLTLGGNIVLTSVASVLAANATLTQTAPWHRISGTPGAVTLNGITAIADGPVDGKLLYLTGTHATNTVTIQDAANTSLNGIWTGGLGDSLLLVWDSDLGLWQEMTRNN